MNITEKAASNDLSDDDLKRLVNVAKDLEEILLEYANSKPVKKIFHNNGESREVSGHDAERTSKFRDFIDKIFEFKYNFCPSIILTSLAKYTRIKESRN